MVSLGFPIVATTVNAGYRVRTGVRRQEAIDTIERGPSVNQFLKTLLPALTLAIVPDNSHKDAYLTFTKDVTHISHVASPIAKKAPKPGEPNLITQARNRTAATLRAAEQTSSVKRVAFTGSVSAITPFTRTFQGSDEVMTINTTAP